MRYCKYINIMRNCSLSLEADINDVVYVLFVEVCCTVFVVWDACVYVNIVLVDYMDNVVWELNFVE
jgi:hypothetical protein